MVDAAPSLRRLRCRPADGGRGARRAPQARPVGRGSRGARSRATARSSAASPSPSSTGTATSTPRGRSAPPPKSRATRR